MGPAQDISRLNTMINLEKGPELGGGGLRKPPVGWWKRQLVRSLVTIAIVTVVLLSAFFASKFFARPEIGAVLRQDGDRMRSVQTEDVRARLMAFQDAQQHRSPEDVIQFYAPLVEYLDHGSVDRTSIRDDLSTFRAHWPFHSETINGEIIVTAEQGGQWAASYKTAFYQESSSRKEWIKGEATVKCKLDGELRISFIQAAINSRERGDYSNRPSTH